MAVSFGRYIPILSISPAEMVAIQELPDLVKDQLLPLFPLRGWSSANHLQKSIERIKESIGERRWIADIDEEFVLKNKIYLFTGELPKRPVFKELKSLMDPAGGYLNWCNFIQGAENAIPCLMHSSLEDLDLQINRLCSYGRGVVLRMAVDEMQFDKYCFIVDAIRRVAGPDVLIIYDLGDIDSSFIERIPLLEKFIRIAVEEVSGVTMSVSATSFPAGFSGKHKGEHSIYERMLFNRLCHDAQLPFIYSDRGAVRAAKQNGGGGTPPPRIDYATKKDWKFVRREIDADAPDSVQRRRSAYVDMAKEVVASDYWNPDLRLWGTQQIELTAEGDEFAIYSSVRSTAVRINMHLYNQLYYDFDIDLIDTDEEWVD